MDFLDILEESPEQIEVLVQKQGDSYCATIAGGWWMAIADKKETAIEKVVKNYEREKTWQ